MKIKLDENMPESLAEQLGQLGHDVHTVPSEAPSGEKDARIWSAARSEQRFLITQDLDFSDVRQFTPGTHAGILQEQPPPAVEYRGTYSTAGRARTRARTWNHGWAATFNTPAQSSSAPKAASRAGSAPAPRTATSRSKKASAAWAVDWSR